MNKLYPATVEKKHDWLDRYAEKEVWKNDVYTVYVNKHHPSGFKYEDGSPVLMTWLSIKRNDRMAKPDWRDFQWIKNQLVGEENEGVELFPAESRLVDGSNQYHLWVFEDTEFRFPFGFTDARMVTQKSHIGETQRKFPSNRIPSDLAECEARAAKQFEELKKPNK